jgi:hypothetical protein
MKQYRTRTKVILIVLGLLCLSQLYIGDHRMAAFSVIAVVFLAVFAN